MYLSGHSKLRKGLLAIFILIGVLSVLPTWAQQPQQIIQSFFDGQKLANGFSDEDLSGWMISSSYTDERLGITYNYVQQQYKDVPVFNAIAPVLIRNGKAYGLKPPFISGLAQRINTDKPQLSAAAALQLALQHLEVAGVAISSPQTLKGTNSRVQFMLPAVANSPVIVELVYVPTAKHVKLAWNISIDLKGRSHWWNVRVDATTGDVLEKNDWVVSCGISAPHDHNIHEASPLMMTPPVPGSGTAQYRVLPLPVESPIHGSFQVLNDPSEPIPSPYGWHDINGVSGAEYNITRGNNVYAYEDANNDDLPGYSPDGGALQTFIFPYSADSSNAYQQNASLTNLFYMNNKVHDVLYMHGFNEVAGNFQQNNYGNGGAGNDYVNAEGFDGGGTNNANFATPPDGTNPRMQMYLWTNPNTGSCTSSLTVNAPVAISGLKSISTAAYNPSSAFNITANVVLALDGVGTSSDGCTAFTNAAAIAGKIALIDRGTCNFNVKTQNAMAAGAIGVIIANNASGGPPTLGGTATIPITIPTVGISLADGTAMKTQLNAAVIVNTTLIICAPLAQLDGSFDNGIVAHEYGHGVSNRLTGGPAASSCLTNAEQGGEGWSDWLALILTIEPGDNGAMSRGIGTYALGQPTTGAGIRRYPYSTNMSINPQTYASLASSSTVHQRGEIWCDVVWDMTWFLIRDFGFSTDMYNGTSGNNIAMRLVLEGMKLQPCSPGYIDARDAILLADDILYGSAHRCQIWEAFARRGMGYLAAQGSSNAVGDETVDFTYPPFCGIPTAPPTANFTAVTTTGACPASIKFNDASTNIPQYWFWNFGDGAVSTQQNPSHTYAQPGTYSVKLKVTNSLGADSLIRVNYITVSTFSFSATATPQPICAGDSVQLSATALNPNEITSYTLSSIPYAPITGTTTNVTLADDAVSAALPIGFNFNFWGTVYSNFYISSNGFIGFLATLPSGCCYGQLLPSTADPNNLIAFAWNDLNPSVNASVIGYFTTGSAPNRKLVVKYATNHYNGTAYPMRGQIILFEGTNVIEIHSEVVTAVPLNVSTQGIENLNGTMAVTPAGRNAAEFGVSNDAIRFTPFVSYQYLWSPATAISSTVISNPKAAPQFTSSYNVVMTASNGCTSAQAVPVTVNLCAATAAMNLRAFIEGYKTSPGSMSPVLYDAGLSTNPAACDSVTIQLRGISTPYATAYSSAALLTTSGYASASFPAAAYGNYYYIVVKSRNGIETWSKNPVRIAATTVFDFTTP